MKLLENLNPQQIQAVTAPAGPILVLAGPGSGKTSVLTHRVAYRVLHDGIPPQNILAVTFTNKAAREMRERVVHLLNTPGDSTLNARHATLGTFHSIAARILRREANLLPVSVDFAIFDQSDQVSLVRRILKNKNIDNKKFPERGILANISAAKSEMIEPEQYSPKTYYEEIVKRVYVEYRAQLLANNGLDFDDLLLWFVDLLRTHPDRLSYYRQQYPHVLVDEFQDTNTVQYTMMRLLSGPDPDLFVVGDPDQSIYRWRGADYRNIRRFQDDFPRATTILLEQNYRSTQVILDCAMAVIDRQQGRVRKKLFTERRGGAHVVLNEAYDELDEAQFVIDKIAELTLLNKTEPGDCAIMYRTNAQSRLLEEGFLRNNLPYHLVGAQRFYGRREIKDLVAYLRLVQNPKDQISLLRILNVPARGLGVKSVSLFLAAAEKAAIAPGELLLQFAQNPDTDKLAPFTKRAGNALITFGRMLEGWLELRTSSVNYLLQAILRSTQYRHHVDDGTDEGLERWENIVELLAVAEEFEEVGLTEFLEHVALISDQDTLSQNQNAPTMLTLHAAKGLEFPVVFIIGLDENILPHQRSFDDPESMAEERRLFYVGITRAKNRLFLSRAFRRRIYGTSSMTSASRFLEDLPPNLVEGDLPGNSNFENTNYQRQTTWSKR
ncbi:MAG: UvrD-helicase domain-containing protein, partial [Phycisphaerae bacterium]|nr:UvrD-helicase domain-containing protein [Phycisphaerae bacterium]